MRRKNVDNGFVSVYEFDFERAKKELNIRHFETADEEWLNFVVTNRRGEPVCNNYDMHIGPVADDNVYQSIRLFESGAYDAEYTVKKLKTEILQDQWVFHAGRILEYVSFVEAKEIRQEEEK